MRCWAEVIVAGFWRWWPRGLSLVLGDVGQGDCRWYWEMLAKVIVAGIGRCWPRGLSLVLGDVGQGDCRLYWEMLANKVMLAGRLEDWDHWGGWHSFILSQVIILFTYFKRMLKFSCLEQGGTRRSHIDKKLSIWLVWTLTDVWLCDI